ncbi:TRANSMEMBRANE PROTEIN [Salix purpurea]|uniref:TRANSMEMBRANE PROTEIN n=1 Tax=Salix purpurea TaxID=77065 RepID=A0A9Q0ULC2_SALPP|nr:TRANSMEMBRANE PROTEIN [Salix purpurea]
MSSSLCSQGVVLATAMAVSGTVILLAFRLQKTLLPSDQFPGDHHQIPESSQQALRSCMSSEGKRKGKKKKTVHFAEDVADPGGDGEEFRRQHGAVFRSQNPSSSSSTSAEFMKSGQKRRMPANRAALYNGILRDRGVQRLAYSC